MVNSMVIITMLVEITEIYYGINSKLRKVLFENNEFKKIT